jgi:FMN phosphatase YigB (HAD superfamily)
MTTKAHPDPKPFLERAKLVILDLDCFLYPYNKTYRNAVLRAWREIEKEYGLPIFRRNTAQQLIEEAKEEAKKNPDDGLCRYISKLAGNLESTGFAGASVFGMLEVYYRGRKVRSGGEDIRPDRALDPTYIDPTYIDPPYKDMIAMAFNLRLLQNRKSKRKSGKKASLTHDELQEKIVEGDKGITRLWHRHMGTGFIRPDAGLVNKVRRLTDAGVEVAVLTHSFKQGKGEAMEKLEKLGLREVISEVNIFGLEEISPHKKGTNPEVFEKVLGAINIRRDPADPIKPTETIMAEDTIGNLQGAKKAGMQTVWVPRRDKGRLVRPSRELQKKLAWVDYVYATPHQFLDALDAAIRASGEAW